MVCNSFVPFAYMICNRREEREDLRENSCNLLIWKLNGLIGVACGRRLTSNHIKYCVFSCVDYYSSVFYLFADFRHSRFCIYVCNILCMGLCLDSGDRKSRTAQVWKSHRWKKLSPFCQMTRHQWNSANYSASSIISFLTKKKKYIINSVQRAS